MAESEQKKKKSAESRYERHREKSAERQSEQSKAGREIGELPAVVDPARKESCRLNLRLFLETYLSGWFELAWSQVHLKAIEKLQSCALDGGLYCYAMPRGMGKTSLAQGAALWATVYGHRSYVVPIGATQTLADDICESIKEEVEANDILFDDFPEVCYPVRCLEGINQRVAGQTHQGKRTKMELTNGLFVFPTIEGSESSNSCIEAVGITGAIRGMKRPMKGRKQHRPDFVILDDPQTDESAFSPTQSEWRARIVNGAVLGLAGPRKKIAAVMPCTVIAPDDMCDRLLNPEISPQWSGQRSKMLLSLPTNMDLWDRYAEIRKQSFIEFSDNRLANDFYAANRSEMDGGAEVSWAERYEPGDLSALQYAMNWRIDRPLSFAAECQQEPLVESLGFGIKEFDKKELTKRLTGLPRGIVPAECTRLTAFVDIGGEILWYMVAAWNEFFGGSVIDYGTGPAQKSRMFSKRDPRPSLSDVYPGQNSSQRVYSGLSALLPEIFGREYQRQNGGTPLRVERGLIDAGWDEAADAVFRAIVRFPYSIFPSKGFARSTKSLGVNRWKLRPNERGGHYWKITVGEGKRGRMAVFDTDNWKTFAHAGMSVPVGGNTSITLYGNDWREHDLLSEHLDAEYAKPQETNNDRYHKWVTRAGGPDNDWLDCLAGCAVAASVTGLKADASGERIAATVAPKRISLAEKIAMKREKQTQEDYL